MDKQMRNDKITYIYLQLKEHKSRNFICNLIAENKICSNSTADRTITDIIKWNKSEIDLYLATYSPDKETVRIVEGNIVDEDAKCKECEIELAGKINELQEEVRIKEEQNKNYEKYIAGLQAEKQELASKINELQTKDNAIEESKVVIAEICKERDDKDEEIRVLNLRLQHEENNFIECEKRQDKLVGQLREKEEEIQQLKEELEEKNKEIKELNAENNELYNQAVEDKKELNFNHKYDSLYKVLLSAYNQAENGKGKERHANDEDFRSQKICEISRRLGSNDYNLGQAVKKVYESKRLPTDRAVNELLGAINYIAAGIIILREKNETI